MRRYILEEIFDGIIMGFSIGHGIRFLAKK